MFGDMPTQSFFARHVKNLESSDLHLVAAAPDVRRGFKFQEVDGLDPFRNCAEPGFQAPKVILAHLKQCEIARFTGVGTRYWIASIKGI